MKFIFNILLPNDVKYSPNCGLIKENIFTEENNIFITVKDEGIGIEKSEIGKIFDSFYRTKSFALLRVTNLGLQLLKVLLNYTAQPNQ